jgi:hypothetical protein
MRYLIMATLLVLSLSLAAQGMNVDTPGGSVSMQITGIPNDGPVNSADVIDQIAAKLDQLEKEVHSKLNKIDQKKAEKIMDDIYGLLAMLPSGHGHIPAPAAGVSSSASASSASSSASSSSAGGSVNINMNISGMEDQPSHKPKPQHHQEMQEPEHKPHNAMLQPMPAADFNALLSKINAESFSDDQMRVLRTAVNNYNFSCDQIIRLIGAFTYSEDKLDALRLTYPKVTDPKNNFNIIDAFTYSSDKEDAEQIINQ